MEKKILRSSLLCCIVFLLISNFYGSVEAGKRRIEITDDLDDVEDNEEDESWKTWGNKAAAPEFDPPPDFSNMGFDQIQEEMAKRTFAPVVGFVKLRLGVQRTKVIQRRQVTSSRMKHSSVIPIFFEENYINIGFQICFKKYLLKSLLNRLGELWF